MTRSKSKRYVVRKSAERMMNILTSPTPWIFYTEYRAGRKYICCSGDYGCGCSGLTWEEEAKEKYKDLPPLEYVRLESRTVAPWKSTGVAIEFPKPEVAETAEVPF